MKKLLFILDCLMFFVVPIPAILLYLLLFDLNECDFHRVVYFIPFFCLLAIVSLFASLSDNHSFYIKAKLIYVMGIALATLGISDIVFHYTMVTQSAFTEFSEILFFSGICIVQVARATEDFKKKNDKRSRDRLIC
ncbi:hypothetical protein [Candidatus Albibeggiatoa sp. nov. BB20]|uniref:hypothetical protein n=1 Tax=Candidatus Albibeggiatoa sp. nov. BB20 TaxID=3162723 RepID=UPI0033657287